MNKRELVNIAADKSGIPKQTLHMYLDLFIESMAQTINDGNSITFSNFGTFRVTDAKERNGWDPIKRKTILVPARKR
ncbi:MAG: HU family DNA-binding protein [Prevotella sp.]|jgi:DNA-binding protein HU-beta|nr:HU family DNA-binding protein [Prevotella sp.]